MFSSTLKSELIFSRSFVNPEQQKRNDVININKRRMRADIVPFSFSALNHLWNGFVLNLKKKRVADFDTSVGSWSQTNVYGGQRHILHGSAQHSLEASSIGKRPNISVNAVGSTFPTPRTPIPEDIGLGTFVWGDFISQSSGRCCLCTWGLKENN